MGGGPPSAVEELGRGHLGEVFTLGCARALYPGSPNLLPKEACGSTPNLDSASLLAEHPSKTHWLTPPELRTQYSCSLCSSDSQ
jgi:hypothetical protein